jgi:hypothetical protein
VAVVKNLGQSAYHGEISVRGPQGWNIVPAQQAASLAPGETKERNRLGWSRWPGAQEGKEPPCDCRVPWGLCSSKY